MAPFQLKHLVILYKGRIFFPVNLYCMLLTVAISVHNYMYTEYNTYCIFHKTKVISLEKILSIKSLGMHDEYLSDIIGNQQRLI